MAHLRPPPIDEPAAQSVPRERDRGQLILVAAFLLAVLFVGLAVVVNSAIFTENLATRSENVDANEALQYSHSVEQAVGSMLATANLNNEGQQSFDDLEDEITDALENASIYTGTQQVEYGSGVSVDLTGTEDGIRIFQNDGTNFTGNDSEEDWTVAEDVDRTRAFTLELGDEPSGDFVVEANDTSTRNPEWVMTVDDEKLTVTADGGAETTCAIDSYPIEIHVTDATIDGSPCPGLVDTEDGNPRHFAVGIDGSYDIEFEGGGNVDSGNYSMILKGENAGLPDNQTAEGQPNQVDAIYSAIVDIQYQTSKVTYETQVRVAPGEQP